MNRNMLYFILALLLVGALVALSLLLFFGGPRTTPPAQTPTPQILPPVPESAAPVLTPTPTPEPTPSPTPTPEPTPSPSPEP
ncbi:MAG: hypothetical protein IJG08_09030, partial [Oscillospiraceae bacterium]|nr:hypothetical protein [Oscillospiraceae bacterium]